MNNPVAVPEEMLKAFETVPDLYLILSPDFFILTASDAYSKATVTQRDSVVGRYLFEVFPDNPAAHGADAVKNLNASLLQVLATRKPHRMGVQQYDVPQTEEVGGGFAKKYWLPLNTPVLDAAGEILYIIHKVEDVTQYITQGEKLEDMKLAVVKQQQKANHILHTLDAAFFELDAAYHLTYLNAKAEAFLGLPAAGILGRNIWEILPQEKDSAGYHAIIKASRHGLKAETEYFSPNNQKWIFLSATPSEEGVIVFMYNRHDIREAQQQIQEREMLRQAEIVGHMGSYEGIIATMQFSFSDNMYRLLGYEPQSFTPTLSWIDSISHPDDAVKIHQILEEAITNHHPYHYLRRIYRPDGEMRYISSHGKVVFDDFGNPVKILGTIQDITEQTRAETEIREQANFIKQITETIPGTISVYDLEQKQNVYINRRQYSQLGYNEQELAALNHLNWIDIIVHPEDRQALHELIQDISTSTDDKIRSLDYRIQTKVGNWEWRRIRSLVFKRSAEGNPIQIISLFHNITDIKRLEAENLDLRLNQQKALLLAILDAQEEERRRISESLHNGIGQLLYATKLNLEQVSLQAPKKPFEKVKKLLHEAIDETRRVSHELVPVLLKDFGLKEALLDLCSKYDNSSFHMCCQINGLQERLETYQEIALYRISQELINNIVKHAKATSASLRLNKQEKYVLLQVRDNGKGFNPESSNINGIGLRSIKDRVNLLNGTFSITKPETGKGTLISIQIPAFG